MTVVTELTEATFDQYVEQHDLVVIDFGAEWCAPCQGFAKVVEHAAVDHPEVAFATVDIDAQAKLAEDFHVRSVPWVMILREQVAIYDESGALSASALEDLIGQAKAVDIAAVKKQLADNAATEG